MTSSVEPSLFSSGAWSDALSQAFGFSIRTLAAGNGARIPFAALDDLMGKRLICLPFTDYVEFPGALGEAERAFAAIAEAHPDQRIAGKLLPADDEGRDPEGFTHRLEVAAPEAMLAAAAQNFRWGVNRATRAGVEVRHVGDAAALTRFRSLFASQRRHKFGILTHPREFFDALARAMNSAGEMFFAESWVDGAFASSALVLGFGNCLYYKFNASNSAFLKHQVNNAVLASIFEHGHRRGYAWIDLGLSWNTGANAGLVDFKDSTGAARRNVYRIERDGPGFAAGRQREGAELMRGLTSYLTALDVDEDALDGAAKLLFRYFI